MLYKSLIFHLLLYGAELWTLLKSDAAVLGVFERIVRLKIFGAVRVGDDTRTNQKFDRRERNTARNPAFALTRPCRSNRKGCSSKASF